MKQRLIDANELHPTYNQGFYIGAGVYAGGSYTLDYEEIEDAPTINAIPVEWVEEYTSRDITADEYWAVVKMLKTWKEENEDN